MFSGIGIICFAASYAVALVLEVTRLLFRSRVRGAAMLGFAGVGLLAHSLFLVNRALSMPGSPLSSELDWYLLAAWVLVAVYLYLVYYHPKTPFGLLLLPLALGLIAAGAAFADREPFAREPASRVWGIIHGTSILLAAVTVLIGFVAGLMYLYQARRLKHKLPASPGLRLPSLEWLQRVNSRALVVSMLTLGVGVLSGMNLMLINYRRQQSTLPWNDPLVLATLGMFAWLLASVVVGSLYRPVRAGRKVAYLTVASFVFLVVTLSAMLFMNTQHGGSSGQRAAGSGQWVVGSGQQVADYLLVPKLRLGNPLPRSSASRVWKQSFQRVRSQAELGNETETHYPLPTAHCPLLTAHYSLPTTHCLLLVHLHEETLNEVAGGRL